MVAFGARVMIRLSVGWKSKRIPASTLTPSNTSTGTVTFYVCMTSPSLTLSPPPPLPSSCAFHSNSPAAPACLLCLYHLDGFPFSLASRRQLFEGRSRPRLRRDLHVLPLGIPLRRRRCRDVPTSKIDQALRRAGRLLPLGRCVLFGCGGILRPCMP